MPSRRKRCSVCGQLHNIEDLRKFKDSGELVCLNCINSHDNMIECEDCHRVYVRYEHFDNEEFTYRFDVTDISGRNVCDECKERLYVKCDGCNGWVKKEEAIEIADCIVCPDCAESEFEECDICHSMVFAPSLRTVNHSGIRVCTSCARNFVQCSQCGELLGSEFRRRAVTQSGLSVTLCNVCAEEYTECTDCHRLIIGHEPITVDEDGIEIQPLCRDCYEKGGESVIHSYHCGEEFVKRLAHDDDVNEALFLGLELEVSGNRKCARRFLRMFEPQTIQLMNDSSVNGFEIITMPMTYKFLTKNFIPQLRRGLQYLIEREFKGHNHGGLHIHVSEEAITKCQAAQLGEILYGNRNDRQTWQKISQRRTEDLHWCSLNGSRKFYDITDDEQGKPAVCTSRHTALNHDSIRTHTYEFRIFNSSLRIDRILKNVECVMALLDYTRKYANCDRPRCNTTDFLQYVTERKVFYPNLNAFLEEQKIIEQHIQKDFSLNIEEREEEVA